MIIRSSLFPSLMSDTISNEDVFSSYIVNTTRVICSKRLIDLQYGILNAATT